MNYIKSLWKGQPTADSAFSIDFSKFVGQGSFYKLQNGKPEIIFKLSNVKFKPGNEEFSYFLVIENSQYRTRNRNNNENINSESCFRISDHMKLVSNVERRNNEDVMTFEWHYDDKNIYGFEFKNRKRDLVTASNFKEFLCKLIFQSKYKLYFSEKIPAHDYLCFCRTKEEMKKLEEKEKHVGCITPNIGIEIETEVFATKNNITVKQEKMEIENEGHISSVKLHEKPKFQSKLQSKYQSKDPKVHKTESGMYQSSYQSSIYLDFDDKTFLYQRSGDLYQLDDFYQFVKMQDSITLCIRFLDKFKHQMEIYGPNRKLLYVKVIETDTSYFIDLDEGIFKWIDIDDDVLRVLAFKLNHDKNDALLELKNVLAHESTLEKRMQAGEYSVKMSPSSIHCSDVKTNLFEKYEEEFQQKIERHENFENCALSESDRAKYCLIEEEERIEMSEIEEFEEEEEAEELLEYKQIYTYHEPAESMGFENNSVSQSKLLDRIFVSRGPIISVFKADDSLKFICNLPQLTTLEKEPIYPKKILFYHNDTKMLILNQVLDKKIYSLDLEKGIVTNEWILDGYNSILDVEHFLKHGELSYNDIFLGINNKNIFQFNPNTHDEESISTKKYTSNPKFSCFSTTQEGYFAIGSGTGDVRLFKETGKNAKNLLPGSGDEIIGLDSTKDGTILVVSTEDYIMVYKTAAGKSSGYLTSLKKLKLAPMRLDLPEDLVKKYGLVDMKFTKAKFDNSYNGEEKYIISTLGRFLILWDLKDVFEGINRPKLCGLKSTILDCEFKNNMDNAIITILEDEVNYIVL